MTKDDYLKVCNNVNSNIKWKVVEFGRLFFAYDENEVKNKKFTPELLEQFKIEFEKFKKHIENDKKY